MSRDEIRNSGDDPGNLWSHAATDLRAYRDAQRALWGDVDEGTLSRYVAGSATNEERESVSRAMRTHPELRACIETVRDVVSVVGMEELTGAPQQTGRDSQLELKDPARGLGLATILLTEQSKKLKGDDFLIGRYRPIG